MLSCGNLRKSLENAINRHRPRQSLSKLPTSGRGSLVLESAATSCALLSEAVGFRKVSKLAK